VGVWIFCIFAYVFLSKKYREIFFLIILSTVIYLIFIAFEYILKKQLNHNLVCLVSLLTPFVVLFIFNFRNKNKILNIITAIFIGSIIFTFSTNYIFNSILEKHQRTRINVFLGIEEDMKGVGYNVNQSKIAIGSGGITGKGFLEGTQTKLDFVPEQDTDFIFCTVGEEWGFLGSATVVILFMTLLLRLVYLAERQRSVFSRIYGYSVASILFLHIAVNIGMTIGLAPVIGIPLPFFSYGGSSLWSFTIMLFVFLRLDVSRQETF
jgi:rod shape determining protein RodA